MASPSPSRQELQAIWWGRVKEALLRYQHATAKLQVARLEHAGQQQRQDGHFAVTQAQRYETLALKKYRCTLEIYYDFVLHGKIPPIDV